MKAGTITQFVNKPETEFEAKKLNAQTTEIFYVENVNEITVTDGEGERTEYEGIVYLENTSAATYDELVAGFVGLKYSTGDEIALMRKGMADSSNEEYVAYVAYVESCKAYCREYFGIDE